MKDLEMGILTAGDYLQDTDGNLGIVLELLGRKFLVDEYGELMSIDDVVEVRKPSNRTCILTRSLWDSAKTIWIRNHNFLGVSYDASQSEVAKARAGFDEEPMEWDDSITIGENNKLIKEAVTHVIVPPADFISNHIIGEGLYHQIEERQSTGKDTFISINGTFLKIKKVYGLQGGSRKKYALVLY